MSELEGTPRVFVSFTDSDAPEALSLTEALNDAGGHAWHMYKERTLKTFTAELSARLRHSDVLALVYSKDTESSNWCPREVMEAIDLDLDLALVLLDGHRLRDLRGGKYKLFMNLETPLHWSTPKRVADELIQRYRTVVPEAPTPRVEAVQRVLIVDDVAEDAALTKGLLALGVAQDQVTTRVQRPFGRGQAGILRIAVNEPGQSVSGRLVVTRNPTHKDPRIHRAAAQLNLPRGDIRIRVLEAFGPYAEGDPRFVLVSAPDFPIGSRQRGEGGGTV